jgi:hypothetical protein
MTAEHAPSVQPPVFVVDGFAEAVTVLSDQRLSSDPAHGVDPHSDSTPQPRASEPRGTSMQDCTPRSTTAFAVQWRPRCLGAVMPRT